MEPPLKSRFSLDHPRPAASAVIRTAHFPKHQQIVTPCFIDRALPGEAQR